MKGFDIEIKNNLLEKKHINSMGIAVWFYMYLVDKITKIDDDGIGYVLGGMPLKYEQHIKKELGISQATYTRWIEKLEKYPYIKTIRTPYGISFRVFKAHKAFKKRVRRSDDTDSAEVMTPVLTSDESNNKTIQYDNTIDIIPTTSEQSSQGKEISEIIYLFKDINPSYKNWFGNKTQRSSVERMIKSLGVETIKKAVYFVPKTNKMQYAPSIHTPKQLEENIARLRDFIIKQGLKRPTVAKIR